MSTQLKDMTGMTFGRLKVIARDPLKPKSYVYWECACSCGGFKSIRADALREGKTLSCGCLGRERRKEACTKHGATVKGNRDHVYVTWLNMKARCYRETHPEYFRYGARGITVCDRWLNSYVDFREDMGSRPYKMSLDRIDNNKGYFKDNCRWATIQDQNNNTRANRILVFRGKSQTLTRWARELGFDPATIQNRLDGCGWDVERALTTPLDLNMRRNFK